MKETSRRPGPRFMKKVLARWRWLETRGVDLERAAGEIGVTVTELRAWSRAEGSTEPLLVPVHVEGEVVAEKRGALVAVMARGVRVEGLTIADVVELIRRLS